MLGWIKTSIDDMHPSKMCRHIKKCIENHRRSGDKEKAQELPLLIATEQPEMWSRCKVREVHCGHKHKEMLNEYMGTKVRFIPSICGNDLWHKTQGYVGTLRCGQAYIWNKNRGLEGYLQTNVMNVLIEM